MINIDSMKHMAPTIAKMEAIADEKLLAQFCDYTDRESYLAWRAEWKAGYAEITRRIRRDKSAMREAARAHAGQPMYASTGRANWDWPLNEEGIFAPSALVNARSQARVMLRLRALAKRDSWAKRAAARQVDLAATA